MCEDATELHNTFVFNTDSIFTNPLVSGILCQKELAKCFLKQAHEFKAYFLKQEGIGTHRVMNRGCRRLQEHCGVWDSHECPGLITVWGWCAAFHSSIQYLN